MISTVAAVLSALVSTQTPPPAVRVFVECPLINRDPLTTAFLTEPYFFRGESWGENHQPPKSMEQQADEAVAYWKTLPPGWRGASWGDWFFTPLLQRDDMGYPGVAKVNPVEDFRRGSFSNLRWETTRLKTVVSKAASANLKIDFSYFDCETQYHAWGFPNDAELAIILNDPVCRSKMPLSVRTLVPPGGKIPDWGTQASADWYIQFGRYCDTINVGSIKRVMYDSGLINQSSIIVNFNYRQLGSFTVYDHNGWPYALERTLDADRTSCMPLYLADVSNPDGTFRCRRPPIAVNKDPLWVALVEDLNKLRSAVANGPFVPVVQTCDWTYNRGIATELLIAHGLRSGVTTWDLFNPPECAQKRQEAAIAMCFAKHHRHMSPVRLNLPEMSLDTDRIDTNGFVTTYVDFMRAMQTVHPNKTNGQE